MEKGETYQLFTPSGCLTEEALFRHTNGLLQAAEFRLVDDHVQACELCAHALEGYLLADPESFSEDISWLNQAFTGIEDHPQPDAHEPDETISSDTGKKPQQVKKRTFLLTYRSELIAASLLLLVAIGGRQVYFELKNSRNSDNQAAIAVKPDQDEEDVVDLSIKPELKEEAGKTTEQKNSAPPIVMVENDLSLNVVNEVSDDVEMEVTIPSSDAETTVLAYRKEEKSVTEKSETNEMTDQSIDGVVVSKQSKSAGRLSQEMDEEETAEAEVFMVVEESPQFPGGDDARIRFLTENINYPAEAREASIQGTVYITFVVEKDGTITEVRVLRGIGGGCDEEAVRVIKNMPRWLPGKQRGKPVRVQFNMPIKFSMAG